MASNDAMASNVSLSRSQAEILSALPEADRRAVIAELTDEQLEELRWDWRFWARPKQLAPFGEWLVWVIRAGRGFGKTRSGSGWVQERALAQVRWVALVARTPADARDYMIEGPGGFLKNTPKSERPAYQSSIRRLTWPNGSWATIYSDEEPDQLRGFSGDTAWLDEFAKFKNPREVWDNLQFGMREVSVDQPRQLITTTPRPLQILRDIEALGKEVVRVVTGSSYENRANLDPRWFSTTIAPYEGTRKGRQEIHAEILDDNPNALWTRELLERARFKADSKLPPMARIVVAIDPSGTDGEDEGDEIGIVAAGKSVDGDMYVFVDASEQTSPGEWGKTAVSLYKRLKADRVVGERNFGGAMVAHVVRTVDKAVSYKEVNASRGKWVRAEPVAALYEQGRVHHVGGFPQLEDEMCAFGPDGTAEGKSPNRLDALVWAATELMLGDEEQMFATAESDLICEPLKLSSLWPRCFAIDCDRKTFAVVWGALDRASDTLYLYDEYRVNRADLAVHAAAIRRKGEWIPGVIDGAARDRSPDESERLLERLAPVDRKGRALIDLFTVECDVEAAIAEIDARMASGRLKVFRTLQHWIAEYRAYRREAGEAPETGDHLMRATGLLATSGPQIAMTEAAATHDEDEARQDAGDQTRSDVTGY